MAAPFKIKSKVTKQLYCVVCDGRESFSSKSGSVAAKVVKEIRSNIGRPDEIKLIRKTTTTETLIVP